MRMRRSVVGALNLFGVGGATLAHDDVVAGQAFADVATIVILQQRAFVESRVLNDQLNSALASRVVIEQAKGMLAERVGLTPEAAFEKMRSHARSHHLGLTDVARSVLDRTLAPGALDSRPGRNRS